MSERHPNDKAQTPPPRDIVREARRLARLRHLRLVGDEHRAGPGPSLPDPKEAA